MLWPVKLNAAANPGSRQSDECRFDDWLAVNQIVTVGFVLHYMNAAAKLGQHHYSKKLVLNPNRLPATFNWLFSNAIYKWERINFAAAALIDALFKEHRIFVRRGGQLGWNERVFYPNDNILTRARAVGRRPPCWVNDRSGSRPV